MLSAQQILNGSVMSWFENRHYGFILGDDGTEYFAHASRFQNRLGLPKGTRVSFSLTEFKGRTVANEIGGIPSAVAMKEASSDVR